MLNQPTPFPYVGSHALAEHEGKTQLVRILAWRPGTIEDHALVSFPEMDGASGNMVVPRSALIDGTPLTAEEAREFHDLDRELFGKSTGPAVGGDGGRTRRLTPRQKARAARRDSLKSRMIWSRFLALQLRRIADAKLWAAA
jgi:hypothetical protein